MKKLWVALILSAAMSASCGEPEGSVDEDGVLEWGTSTRGACNVATPCNATPNFGLSDVPTTMDPGEKYPAVLAMVNSGTGVWDTTFFRIYSQHVPRTFWGTPYDNVEPPILPGETEFFNVGIRAPAGLGDTLFDYRMREGALNLSFGTAFQTTITVQEQQRFYDCLNNGAVPALMTAAESVPFTFAISNSGTASWPTAGGLFRLCERDNNTFGPTECVNLTTANTVPPGQTEVIGGAGATFTFNLIPPAAPGTYQLIRQMRDSTANGIGNFDDDLADSCINVPVEVTLCGNNNIDGGEQCDDGNLTSLDGCDSACQIDGGGPMGRIVDLATDPSDRELDGLLNNRALGNVVMADVGGTSPTPEVIVGENADAAMPSRGTAGRVTVYDGDGFFAGGTTTVPAGSLFNIVGEDSADHLGGSSASRIAVGDVTGDGVNDLIVSADGADGPMNGRSNCGEVYVIVGGAGLTGTIDLRAPPPGVVGNRIYGAEVDARIRILAVGSFGGTAALDLVI